MATIISEGPTLSDWSAGAECASCFARYEFTGEDLLEDTFKTSGYWFAGTAVTVEKILVECPKCRDCITFDVGLPHWVARLVREASRKTP